MPALLFVTLLLFAAAAYPGSDAQPTQLQQLPSDVRNRDPPQPPAPPQTLDCSAPDGKPCVNETAGSGCGTEQHNGCTCQISDHAPGFICGRTCNGRPGKSTGRIGPDGELERPQCSADIRNIAPGQGCPQCCTDSLFNNTACAACYQEQCTFDCDQQGAICSAQCIESCFLKSMVKVHMFNLEFWRMPFKPDTCMADCWSADTVDSVLDSLKTVATTFGVVLPYLFRFLFDFALQVVLEMLHGAALGLWSRLRTSRNRHHNSTPAEQEPLLSDDLQRGISHPGPAPRAAQQPEVSQQQLCLRPCAEIPLCQKPSTYRRCARLQEVLFSVVAIVTIVYFVLQLLGIAIPGSWDEAFLGFVWALVFTMKVFTWTPVPKREIYAPGSRDVNVPAAPGFTMFDLQGHQSTWSRAVKDSGLSSGQAVWFGFKRMIFWHLSQPAMYAVVLTLYWPDLLLWQKWFASLVAFRELTYVFFLLLALRYNPAFLLVDTTKSLVRMDDTLHPINGWLFLVVYVFAPEKFVGLSLLQRQDRGHDTVSVCSCDSPYFRPRNRAYAVEAVEPISADARRRHYLPNWVGTRIATAVFVLIALLDLAGWLALVIPHTPLAPTDCVQFYNTATRGGPVDDIWKYDYDGKHFSQQRCNDNNCKNAHDPCSLPANITAAESCEQQSQKMHALSTGERGCRYTAWPDALFFCYVVTVLSGAVLVTFGVYRWLKGNDDSRVLVVDHGSHGAQLWAFKKNGKYHDVESGKLIPHAIPLAEVNVAEYASSKPSSRKRRSSRHAAAVARDSFVVEDTQNSEQGDPNHWSSRKGSTKLLEGRE